MDASERIEAAQAMLDAPADEPTNTETTTPDTHRDAPTSAAQPPAAVTGEQPAHGSTQADAGEGKVRQEAPQAAPAETAGAEAKTPAEDLQALLGDGKRTVADVRQAIDDSETLYKALRGETPLEGIVGWIEQQYPEAYAKLQQMFAGKSSPAGTGANAATPAAGASPTPADKGDGKTRDALAEIDGLKARLDEGAKQAQTEAARRKTVEDYDRAFTKLAEQAGVDPNDRDDYSDFITRSIGRDAKALERLEKGSLVDVERLFNEYHGRMLDRVKRWADKQIAAKRSRDGSIPRTPAGGSPPAPATRRLDLTSKEDRVAAATETFREA